MKKLQGDFELNLYKLGENLTDEMYHFSRRMKQKLLYQIGLIDDPWKEEDDMITDG